MVPGSWLLRTAGAVVLALGLLLVTRAARAQCPTPAEGFTPDPEFTSSFMLESCKFKTKGENPFFPLRPGWQTVLESAEEVGVTTVLHETRKVDGVKTRVVEELAFERDGDELVPVERSLNFFAICEQTGSVVYFGEEVEFFDEDGNPIPGTGAWRAGENGARPGIIMPGTILVGGGFYNEIAPENSALDKDRILAIHEGCEAGDLEFEQQCVEMVETSDCEPTAQASKVFVAGVGIVVDGDLEVTRFGFVKSRDEGERSSDGD